MASYANNSRGPLGLPQPQQHVQAQPVPGPGTVFTVEQEQYIRWLLTQAMREAELSGRLPLRRSSRPRRAASMSPLRGNASPRASPMGQRPTTRNLTQELDASNGHPQADNLAMGRPLALPPAVRQADEVGQAVLVGQDDVYQPPVSPPEGELNLDLGLAIWEEVQADLKRQLADQERQLADQGRQALQEEAYLAALVGPHFDAMPPLPAHIADPVADPVLELEMAFDIQESIEAEQQQAVLDARNVQDTLKALDPQEVIALAKAIFGVENQDLNECKRMLCDRGLFEALYIDFEKQSICLKAILDLIPGERPNVDKADRVLCYFYYMFSGAKEIDASGLGFEEAPQMVAAFPDLQNVNLSDNNLRSIPPFLEGENSPRILDLSNNQITDATQPLNLPKTQILDLGHNRLTQVPIFKLNGGNRSLRVLNLTHNDIVDTSGIAGLQGLEGLDLSSNQITELYLPLGLCFKKMNSLSLVHNPIDYLFPEAFRDQMPALREFSFFVDSKETLDSQMAILNKARLPSVVQRTCVDGQVYVQFATGTRYDQGPLEEVYRQIDPSLLPGTYQEVVLPDGTAVMRYNPGAV